MRTAKRYYEQPLARESQARVVAVHSDGAGLLVELDGTILYPEGGGQPCDRGFLAGLPVSEVTETGDGRILHRIAAPAMAEAGAPAAGDTVSLALDWARRLDHSQQHSAQHLLSATILRLCGGPTRSFHLGERYSVIDVDLPAIPWEDALMVEDQVLCVIREDWPMVTHLCPPEDASRFPLRRAPPEGEEVLRIVEIDGLDFTPCCGTHLSSTGMMGLFRVLRTEKYKGMTRVYFVAGQRAYADYRGLARSSREAAAALGVGEDDLADGARSVAARLRSMELEAGALKNQLAGFRAKDLSAMCPSGPVKAALDWPFDETMAAARALAELGRLAILGCIPDLKAVAAAPRAQAALGQRLKDAAVSRGGKGGGGPTLFQAAFPDARALDEFLDAAAGILS